MNENLRFEENFFSCMSSINKKIEKLLVDFIHVLKSLNVQEDYKHKVRDSIVMLGKEINSFYSSVNINKITQFDLREFEKRIIDKNNGFIKEIEKITDDIEKKKDILIDNRMIFSIEDILKQLSEIRIENEYAITKDKIDNLFAIKRFIADIYFTQFKNVIENEKKLDKDLFSIKEKTFLEVLRNGKCVNPQFYFKTLEIVKKLIAEGKTTSIWIDGNELERGIIWMKEENSSCIIFKYSNDGLEIDACIGKYANEKDYKYKVIGSISKGVSCVNYSIEINTFPNQFEQIEHMLGYDFLQANYEKNYIDYSKKKDDAYQRNEEINKTIVNKAIDDILF
jgi:hypothetical protein